MLDTGSWRATRAHVLDGAVGVVFSDGFESGDTGAWSATLPP